jgi:hypothetical protein
MMSQKKASRPAELGQISGRLRQSSASQLFFLTHDNLVGTDINIKFLISAKVLVLIQDGVTINQ